MQNQYQVLLEEGFTNNERNCPSCQLLTLQGMPGGRDSVCKNCGYKDPCCYD